MLKFPVGLQLYSVREQMAEDFEGTLKKVKEMGYDAVEFAGLFGRTANEVKALCEEIGLVPVSAHVAYAEIMQDPDKVLGTYAEIGCKFIVIPYLSEEYRPGSEKFEQVLEDFKMIGQKVKDLGMKLCYHNHDFEFVKINGEYGLDIIFKTVPADLLETELDTCWVNVGGENPAEYVKKYAGRTTILHLKDFVGHKTDNMYALIGIDDDKKSETSSAFEYRPVGYGLQNFPEILSAAEESGTEWVIVEQDEPSMGKSRMELAQMSIEYLKSL